MSRFGKKRSLNESPGVELNIMPFIDIFSLLCTFLLYSAVFISIGIHVVQVPFLTNAAPEKEKSKPARILEITVTLSKHKITLKSLWSERPVRKKVVYFNNSDLGFSEFQANLENLKIESPKTEKVNIYIDDDMTYEEMVPVLDSIKLGKHNQINVRHRSKKQLEKLGKEDDDEDKVLFPKIVFSSVIL